jgi:hypothetical protein
LAKVTTDVNKGIVVATLGYWRQLNNGVVNSVSSNAFGDMGHSPYSLGSVVFKNEINMMAASNAAGLV